MSTPARSTPLPAPRSRGDYDGETRHVPDQLVEAFTVIDPELILSLKANREANGLNRRDEMWDGVYVVSPDPNFEHQSFAGELTIVFGMIRNWLGGGYVLPGLNVSDRVKGWMKNYRVPDVAVYLPGNPAQNCGTHMCGGPDFAVEILSEHDLGRKKLDFYAKVNTQEILFIDRDPWILDLYRLIDGHLALVGSSTPDDPALLSSQVLPLTFRLVSGGGRPTIEVVRADGGQTWRI